MKNISKLIMILAVLVCAASAQAQDIKTISWNQFTGGEIQYTKTANGQFEFTHANRALTVYTLVAVPAGTLVVHHHFLFETTSETSAYLLVLDPLTMQVRDASGALTTRPASARILFPCRKPLDEAGCMSLIETLLQNGVKLQSMGVPNADDQKSGVLPDTLTLAFLLNPDQSKFR